MLFDKRDIQRRGQYMWRPGRPKIWRHFGAMLFKFFSLGQRWGPIFKLWIIFGSITSRIPWKFRRTNRARVLASSLNIISFINVFVIVIRVALGNAICMNTEKRVRLLVIYSWK